MCDHTLIVHVIVREIEYFQQIIAEPEISPHKTQPSSSIIKAIIRQRFVVGSAGLDRGFTLRQVDHVQALLLM